MARGDRGQRASISVASARRLSPQRDFRHAGRSPDDIRRVGSQKATEGRRRLRWPARFPSFSLLFSAADLDFCAGSAGPFEVCTTGQMRCEGALLQTRADDRTSWVTVQGRGAAALCQVSPRR